MKIYAYYLPQFHEIPENNEWHGEGFTEWTNVKKATSLFKGHVQPIHPINDNYYNLLKEETVKTQIETAKEYGVDGFVYYHYWFKGKTLMEKPAENFLQWKHLDHGFFFCWANHSFYNRWDGSNKLLLEQTYGTEKDWKEHFDYLLPFFKDERYLKVNNKPVLSIYRGNFGEKEKMLKYMNTLCKENGFEGLYYLEVCSSVETYNVAKNNLFPTVQLTHMPNLAIDVYSKNRSVKYFIMKLKRKIGKALSIDLKSRYQWYEGNELLCTYVESDYSKDNNWSGMFFSWDNTPRYGKRGFVISEITKDVFIENMNSLKDKKFIIINAWNEWAEGMILEPSKENGYKYLEWIREWKEKCQ